MRPRWGQAREFCRRQGFRETKTDHYYYDKVLPDGSTAGTKVSYGADAETVPTHLWTRVWRRQLRLKSEDDFWKGLTGEPIEYDIPATPLPSTPLPRYLTDFLRDVLHYTPEQIAATERDEAQALLNRSYAGQLREPP